MATDNKLGVSPVGYEVETAVTKDRLVKLGTADKKIVPSAAATDVSVGVALETKAAAELCPVQMFGPCRGTASGAITRGDRLMWATGGKVATLSGATAKIVGYATMSAADGDVFDYLGTFPSVNDTQ